MRFAAFTLSLAVLFWGLFIGSFSLVWAQDRHAGYYYPIPDRPAEVYTSRAQTSRRWSSRDPPSKRRGEDGRLRTLPTPTKKRRKFPRTTR